MQDTIIIVRRASAIGKSTVCKVLKEQLHNGVIVETDDLRSQITNIDWNNQDLHFLVLKLTSEIVHFYLKEKVNPVFVVDSFSPRKLAYFLSELKQIEQPTIISLYASEEILIKRQKERESEWKNLESSLVINKRIKQVPFLNGHLIDTSEMSVKDVVQEILKVTNLN